jgi:hypothetical protein
MPSARAVILHLVDDFADPVGPIFRIRAAQPGPEPAKDLLGALGALFRAAEKVAYRFKRAGQRISGSGGGAKLGQGAPEFLQNGLAFGAWRMAAHVVWSIHPLARRQAAGLFGT